MGKKAPHISVIMPCFNAQDHLDQSVSSVLNQTFKSFELIVVNDGSTDDSIRILEGIKDQRIRIVSQSNHGVSSARNRGIKEAKGRYLAFLDADDTWDPFFLEKMITAIEASPSAAIVYCGWQNLGLSGQRGMPYTPPDYEKSNKLKALLTTCPWPIHAVLVHKWAVVEGKGFDETLSTSEDYKLWLTIATRYEIVRLPEVLAYYHFHEGPQATKNILTAVKNHVTVKQKFLNSSPGVKKKLGPGFIREITYGQVLKRGYECYWARDLVNARQIFHLVMKTGYGRPGDWIYMLPALLPLSIHRRLIRLMEKTEGTPK